MKEIDIFGTIIDFRPSESYILTYSSDLNFYEGYVLPCFQRLGCRKNVVLMDGGCFDKEIESCPEALNYVGKEYILLPIHSFYAFHPKVYLFKRMTNKQIEILCFVGSGNLTYPGLNTNFELFSQVKWESGKEFPGLLKGVHSYILSLFDSFAGRAPQIAKEWLQEHFPKDDGDDNENSNILTFPSNKGIFDNYIDEISNEKINSLVCMAPFFDNDLSALTKVVSVCSPKEVTIIIQPDTVQIRKQFLDKVKKLVKQLTIRTFASRSESRRYLHGKLIIAQSKTEDHVLFGSANISDAALFGKNSFGNYEACIYSKHPTSKLIKELDLFGITRKVTIDELEVCEPKTFVSNKSKDFSPTKLIVAEFYDNEFRVFLSKEIKKDSVKIKVLTTTGINHIVTADKQYEYFVVRGLSIEKAQKIIACCLDSPSENNYWIPVQFVAQLKNIARIVFPKAEQFKRAFLAANEEREEFQYLGEMVDYLIGEWRKHYEEDRTAIKTLKVKEDSKQNTRPEVVIRTGSDILKHQACNQSLIGIHGIMPNIFSYILLALREKKVGTPLEGELIDDKDDDFDISEQSTKQEYKESGEHINTFEEISRTLKRWRRLFMKNASITDFLTRSCYFSVIALPHIPKLNKCYKYGDCVPTTEWCEFIENGIGSIYPLIFNNTEQIWPEISIDSDEKEMFERIVASLFYTISAAYPFLEREASNLGIDARSSKIAFIQIHLLYAALIRKVLELNHRDQASFNEVLSEIENYCPCEQDHLKRSVEEFKKRTDEYSNYDFGKNKKSDMGGVFWKKGTGFVIESAGESIPLLKKGYPGI